MVLGIRSSLIASMGNSETDRTAAVMGIHKVTVFSEDDSRFLHVQEADEAISLRGDKKRPCVDTS